MLAPACSIIFATSCDTSFVLLKPFLIFTLTGLLDAFTTSSTILPIKSKFCNNLLPSPFFTIFGAGHPMFISTISKFLLNLLVAYVKDSISLPKI